MSNKIVTTIEKSAIESGCHSLCFNFRGVGESDGVYDGGEGEQQDLLSVIEWAKTNIDFSHLHLAGFSFGSYVAYRVAQQIDIASLLLVAPPLGNVLAEESAYDFSWYGNTDFGKEDQGEAMTTGWQHFSVIIGGCDEVVESQQQIHWAMEQTTSLPQSPDIYVRASASHFFHGQLVWLKKILINIYQSNTSTH